MSDLCVLAATLMQRGLEPDDLSVPLEAGALVTTDVSGQHTDCNVQIESTPRVESLQLEFSSAVPEGGNAPIATSTLLKSVAKSAKPHPHSNQTAIALLHPVVQPVVDGPALPQPEQRAEPTAAVAQPSPVVERQPIALVDVPAQPLPSTSRPASNGQLYRQRVAALQAGQTYTRLPPDSFRAAWQGVAEQPTYEQWIGLLNREAHAMARGQGSNRLTVMLGDSISQWFPTDYYSRDRFWLNQGISGDTTGGILRRLSALDQTRPDRIHIMAGINDLRRGVTDPVIVGNLRQIIIRLQLAHPQAQIVLHSILPTQLAEIPADRVQTLNQQLEAIATQYGTQFLNLTHHFADENQRLQPALTTDGLHLSPRGYQVWEWAMRSSDVALPTLTARYQAYDE